MEPLEQGNRQLHDENSKILDLEKLEDRLIRSHLPNYAIEVFTGIRPTGSLTVANYVGAVEPTLRLVESGLRPLVFVADLHGMTTHEPCELIPHTREVLIDYLALGMDPDRSDLFIQSAIAPEIFELMAYLMRHITISELLRVPTLKDKLKAGENEKQATAFLATYPLMMAADILIQRAHYIPVGEDQTSHIELTRHIAHRFNSRYGEVFPEPEAMKITETLKVLGLKGSGKMGKSSPDEAIFLTDSPDTVQTKVRQAKTAFAGEMSDALESHLCLGKALSVSNHERQAFDELKRRHLEGEGVMGSFKTLLTDVLNKFLEKFQTKRKHLLSDSGYLDAILEKGNMKARENARETLSFVRQAMMGKYD